MKRRGNIMKSSRYNFIFSLGNGHSIVFNALSRSLVIIPDHLADELRNNHFNTLLARKNVLETLKRLHIITDDGIDENLIFKYISRSEFFSKEILSLFISLTNMCNLACIYCYQSNRKKLEKENPKILTKEKWEILRKFLEQRIENHVRVLAIALFGGEPLLNSEVAILICKDLARLAEEYSISLDIALITNGTLLDNHLAEEILNSVDTVQITLDGLREVHDTRRPLKDGRGGFDKIFRNLLMTIDRYKKNVNLRINVDEYNINHATSLIDYLSELGLQSKLDSIDVSPIIPSQDNSYVPFKTSKSLTQYYKEIIARILDVLEYIASKGFRIPRKFMIGPCIAKFSYGFAVDEDLNIYKCPAFLYSRRDGLITRDGAFRIESIYWYRNLVIEPPCTADCKYAPLCYGGCTYLRQQGVSTCLRYLYGENSINRLISLYVKTRYSEMINNG